MDHSWGTYCLPRRPSDQVPPSEGLSALMRSECFGGRVECVEKLIAGKNITTVRTERRFPRFP